MIPIFTVLSRACRAWRRMMTCGAVVIASSLAGGCVPDSVHSVIHPKDELPQPRQQLDDYLTVGCTRIWQLAEPASENNPLYWLRAMDCARSLSPAEARVIAHRHEEPTWQEAFRRGILLADARITPQERQRYMTTLDATADSVPPHVQPLYQVWRAGQQLQLKLVAERGRYNKLRQTTDTELEGMRVQQTHLQSQLEATTRKLKSLTDIERQLSTRKPSAGYLPDASQVSSEGAAAPDSHSVKEKQ
ncbi:putative alpha helix protein [Shimwellia blattae DSM 4481 = NBRC 105725]|uniref:Putative alpha helix protein n=2 Tax=Shimwellia blattae TaxID=563 RepID=I2B6G7_SHIBC|nr:putative alpha helix protein [Shimwellia blattae DSM 4481 = NBRC 105725]VDY63592.1 Quorum-sensing regulator protein G precursor [Shimwellia blattae]VEC21625.1 Quorum-sensing regulator protein G precursor [Shimwellia blattae]